MAFDDPIIVAITAAIVLLLVYAFVFRGKTSNNHSNKVWIVGWVLIALGLGATFLFDFLIGAVALIVGILFLWTSRNRGPDYSSFPDSTKSKRTSWIVPIIGLALVALLVGFVVVNSLWSSYESNALLPYQPSFHYPYIGETNATGIIVSANSSNMPGFLGIGTSVKETVVVYVPVTGNNFSQSFLFCDSLHVGDSVQVYVYAYNSTFSQFGFASLPSNVTSINSVSVTNTSFDKTITIVSANSTITRIDEIGRDYMIINPPSHCAG